MTTRQDVLNLISNPELASTINLIDNDGDVGEYHSLGEVYLKPFGNNTLVVFIDKATRKLIKMVVPENSSIFVKTNNQYI